MEGQQTSVMITYRFSWQSDNLLADDDGKVDNIECLCEVYNDKVDSIECLCEVYNHSVIAQHIHTKWNDLSETYKICFYYLVIIFAIVSSHWGYAI